MRNRGPHPEPLGGCRDTVTSEPSGTVRSICPYCAVGCGLLVDIRDGVAWRVRGDKKHPANFGRLCRKGVLLPRMLRTPDRLLYPLDPRFKGLRAQRVSWDEALDFVAAGLQRIIERDGSDAVAFYGSGQLVTEDYYLLAKLAKETNSRLCMTSAAAAYTLACGADGPPSAHADVEEADCFLILGANMEACHPVLFQRVRARKQASPEDVSVIVVDPGMPHHDVHHHCATHWKGGVHAGCA